MAKGVPVRSAGGRVVGRVVEGVLVKHVKGSIHRLREPVAWACDVAVLEQAEAAGARDVVILDDETGIRYRASVAAMWEHGVRLERGFGPQVALPLERWQRTAPGELEPVQLHLW